MEINLQNILKSKILKLKGGFHCMRLCPQHLHVTLINCVSGRRTTDFHTITKLWLSRPLLSDVGANALEDGTLSFGTPHRSSTPRKSRSRTSSTGAEVSGSTLSSKFSIVICIEIY